MPGSQDFRRETLAFSKELPPTERNPILSLFTEFLRSDFHENNDENLPQNSRLFVEVKVENDKKWLPKTSTKGIYASYDLNCRVTYQIIHRMLINVYAHTKAEIRLSLNVSVD